MLQVRITASSLEGRLLLNKTVYISTATPVTLPVNTITLAVRQH
jgi:hypothetical protein